MNAEYATYYDPNAESEIEVPLPNAALIHLSPNVSIQPPLSRLGSGPPLIVFVPEVVEGSVEAQVPEGYKAPLDPHPQYKWAEEGYAVLEMRVSKHMEDGAWSIEQTLKEGLPLLFALEECTGEKAGALVFEGSILAELLPLLSSYPSICCMVAYNALPVPTSIPTLLHLAAPIAAPTPAPSLKIFTYDDSSPYFILPTFPGTFGPVSSQIAHTRTLTFLKAPTNLAGPHFDLEAIWDEHTFFEFNNRSVAKTMGTMVAEPYVNHIPTMTGGIGRKALGEFYRDHFIFSNPPDTVNICVSRVVGIDRVCEEFVMEFTHTTMVNWMAPGVPPTGLKIRIPMTVFVCIRGDRLYHEHIGWDQATVLRQMQILPRSLPFPFPIAGKEGKKLEVRLPILGVETTIKLEDEHGWTSNELIGTEYELTEV